MKTLQFHHIIELPRGGRAATLLLFGCVSGMAGLSGETLYLRVLSTHVFDDAHFAMLAVLSGVFLGMSAGAALSTMLARHVWIIEGAFGVFSLLVALLVARGEQGEGGALAAFCAGFFPFLFIGAVVPSLSALMGEHVRRDRGFSLIYGVYNLFAGLAVLLTEYVLTRSLGLQWSLALFGAVNLAIAAGLRDVCMSSRLPPVVSLATDGAGAGEIMRRGLPLLLLGCGATLWHLHVVDVAWLLLGDSYEEAFALVLASAIWGLAFAGLLAVSLRVSLLWSAVVSLILSVALLLFAGEIVERWAALMPPALLVMLFLPPFAAIGMAAPAAAQQRRPLSGAGILTFLAFGNLCGLLGYSLLLRDTGFIITAAVAVCFAAAAAAAGKGRL